MVSHWLIGTEGFAFSIGKSLMLQMFDCTVKKSIIVTTRYWNLGLVWGT